MLVWILRIGTEVPEGKRMHPPPPAHTFPSDLPQRFPLPTGSIEPTATMLILRILKQNRPWTIIL